MRTTFDTRTLKASPGGSVISIGVFDGVHLGHQAILKANVARAKELGAEATVLTFRRHPKKLLLGRAPKTLTTLDHRLELFRRAHVEHTFALSFDESLRELSARDFAQVFLSKGLNVRELVLGFDSKFGRERQGTPEYLQELGYTVQVVPQVIVDSRPISSTAIREAVELGDLPTAAKMLGRPVSTFGKVVHGQARGAGLGFPTANLDLHHELHPPVGVYAVRAHRMVSNDGREERSQTFHAVANIGYRPTIDKQPSTEPVLEVHLLDFEGDLYGERLELEFEARLRGEKRFGSIDELQTQIASDIREARQRLQTC